MDKITLGTRKVSIEFPGVKALSDVDFEISTGMIHAVMGANGAGKSTLMKVLAGSNPDYTGDVLYNGNVVELRNPAAAKKLGIQIVYQEVDMALIPTLSVAENVMFNDMVMNMGHKQFVNYGKIRKDAKEALARLNIDIDVKRWCGTLTLAQKQMVLIARAVQNSCNFLILDEPTSYLDVKYKLEFLSVLQEMKRKKKLTVIMSLHEIELAEIISDQILCIREHRVDRMGTPAEVLDKGYIAKLFDITEGSYEETTGNVELPAPRGEPEVFVMAGGGSGRRRHLQPEFCSGMIWIIRLRGHLPAR